MPKREIRYGIGFDVNKAGLEELKKELKLIQSFTKQDILNFNPTMNITQAESALAKIKQSAGDIETALQKSFNPKLNSISLQNFEKALKSTSTGTVPNAVQGLRELGDVGKDAFFKLTSQLLTTKREIKETHSMWSKFSETLANTVRWKIASSALDTFTGSIQKAWGYAKRLDQSLNDIRIVTGKSADEMERFAKQANKAAKSLGASTTNYTNAALIYYQQGLSEKDVAARAGVTVKAANVTGQSASEVSEQLTAVWNGYKVVAEEAESYIDKLAAVAANTAADLEELSDGMSKVASAAATMGVDVDQLSAQLSTIISVTRQDASVVGTALKTIYARMGDLKVDGVDEFGTSLGDVSSQLQQMGIDVLDQQGNLRDMGNVIEEVAAKWGTWTDAQQQAAAVAIAGKRQYNNLIALFENWDMYESALTTSQTSAGTLQKQQDIYMDSIEAHLNKLTVSAEKFYDALINSDSMNTLIDGLTKVVDLAAIFTESIGGAGNLLMALGPIFSRSLGPQLGNFISTEVINQQNKIFNKKENSALNAMTGKLSEANIDIDSEDAKTIIALKQKQLDLAHTMTEEELAASDQRIASIVEEIKGIREKEAALNEISEIYKEDLKLGQKNSKAQLEQLKNSKASLLKIKNNLSNADENSEEYKNNKNALGSYGILHGKLNKKQTMSSVDSALSQMDKEIASLEKGILQYDQKMNESLDSQIDGYEKLLELRRQDLDEIKQEKIDSQNILNNLTKANTENEKANIALKQAPSDVNQGRLERRKEKANQDVSKAWKDADKYVADLNKKIKENTNLSEDNRAEISSLVKKYEAGNITLKEKEEILERISNALNKAEKETKEETKAIEENTEQLRKQNDELNRKEDENARENFKKSIESRVQSITNFIGTAMSLIAVVGIIKNLGSIWNDEDLTTGEKITQTITGIISILLTTIPVITSVATTWIAAEKAKQTANKITEKTAWASLGPYILIAAAIAAVAAGLIALFASVGKEEKTALEKAQESFDKAKKSAEDAKNKLKELRDEYNGFMNDISSYKEARLAIDDMREGTEEWQQAVQELNLQVMDLITKYPELAEFMTTESTVGGATIYGINQDGITQWMQLQRKAILEQNKLVAATNVGVYTERENVLKESNKDTINKKIDSYFDKKGIYYNQQEGIVQLITQAAQDEFAENDKIVKAFEGFGVSATPDTASQAPGIEMTTLNLKTLQQLSDEEIKNLQETLNANTDIDEDLRLTIQELINTNTKTNEELVRNQVALDAATKAYLRIKADEKGYNLEIYNDFVDMAANEKGSTNKNGSTNKRTKTSTEYKKEIAFFAAGEDGDYQFRENDSGSKNNVGEKIDTSGDRKAAFYEFKKTNDEVFGPGNWESSVIDENWFRGEYVGQLGEKKLTFNKEVMSFSQWGDLIAQKKAEKEIDELTKQGSSVGDYEADLNKLVTEGKNQAAAYFMSGRQMGTSWDNASVSGYNELSTYSSLGGEYLKRVEAGKNAFIDYINDTYTLGSNRKANDIRFANFTENDFKAFSTNISKMASAGFGEDAINGLLNTIGDNPELNKAVNDAMSKVTSWSDPTQVNEFRATLIDLGIDISAIGKDWDKAFNDVNAGWKQWISNSKKVIENLATINDITKDLKAGEIISVEDFEKLAKISPEITSLFIKTADGMKALVSGSQLNNILKNQYKDLDKLKEYYEDINNIVKVSNLQGKSNFNVDEFANSDASIIKDFFNKNGITQLAAELGIKGIDTLLSGLNEEKDSNTYINAANTLAGYASQLNQVILDAQNGLFTSEAAEEYWATSVANSWSEVRYNKNISTNTKNKAETMWKNTYLSELGFENVSKEIVKALDITEVEEAVVAARKLELDYLKEINSEVEKNEILMKTAFGLKKASLLKEQIDNQKNAYQVAVQNKEWANAIFQTGLAANGFEKDATLTDILNKRSELSPESPEAKVLDELIKKWEEMENAANAVIEASQAVIDAQIENYEYQLEMQNKITESLRKIRDLAIEFNDFATEGLSVFEEEKAVNKIEKTLIKLEDNSSDLTGIYNNLENYSNISEIERTSSESFRERILGKKLGWNLLENLYNNSNSSFKDKTIEFLLGINREDVETFLNSEINPFYDKDSGIFNAVEFEKFFGKDLDKAREVLTSMREELQTLYDSYLQAQDEILELYDKEIQKLSTINGIYSTMADLSAIVGENTSQYYSRIASNLSQSYSLAEQQYAAAQAEYNKLFRTDEEGKLQKDENGNPIRKDDISQEIYDKVADNLAAAANNLTDLAQQTLEAVANNFSAKIKEAVDGAIEATHGLNLAAASEAWELANAANEGYLDEVNARYNIDQLNRKIQTSIDESDNYAAQKKLADLRAKQEQRLNDILEERGKLSQYELDRANAEYELTLKQIALEEAQQTANKMKLTRDTMGNYTYQYVADQDAIAKAEEELAAAENNLYNIDRERNKSLVDEYYTTMTEANEAIAEAMAQGDTKRVERLRNYYFDPSHGIIAGIQSELKESSRFLKEIGSLVTGEEFSDSITQTADQIASIKLFDYKEDGKLKEGLLTTLSNIIGNDESGGIKALKGATENISSLLARDGILQSVVNSVAATQKNTTDLTADVNKLSNSATTIINKLPPLVSDVKSLSDELDRYANKYQAWLDTQVDTSELGANTEALISLTRTIIEFKDTVKDGILDGKDDGKEIVFNGWSFDGDIWVNNTK